MIHAEYLEHVGMATVVDSQRVYGPAPDRLVGTKSLRGALEGSVGELFDHREDTLCGVRSSVYVVCCYMSDVRFEVFDRLRSVYGVQDLSAASIRRRASLESTLSAWLRESRAD